MGKYRTKKSLPGNFSRAVYKVVSRISPGEIMTYADVARAAGFARAARAVGSAMKKNTDPGHIPCHRVIRSDGSIGGYAFGGINKKAQLLKQEGVAILRGKVILPRKK